MPTHFQHYRGSGEQSADPETARHVGEFGIRRIVEACNLRLQRHAADRAGAGSDLANLWMHRAGVDRAGGNVGLPRFRFVFAEIFGGVSFEFGPTASRAEMKSLALVF